MNYIVFDLEWNQSPKGKKYEIKEIPFEIIEIGAIKLNEKLEIIDQFERVIRPQLYKELHFKTQEIITIGASDLKQGDKAYDVMTDFLMWCGTDYIFCTWGSTDLIELQRNIKYFKVENPYNAPFIYYDIQKIFSILHEDGKHRSTLQYASDFLGIQEEEDFHRAINDARYTAKIIRAIDFENGRKRYSIDCYNIPYRRSNEVNATFDTYHKYISRGFRKKEHLMADTEVLSARCYKCGSVCSEIIPWFSTTTKSYYGLFECEQHGLIKGKIRAKLADNGKFYAIKILKMTDEDGAAKIDERRQSTREKRKMRRHREDGLE